MQATEKALSDESVDLWNTARIDTHRDLELHDEDKDLVVQSTNPAKTAAEAIAAKLPKTNDVSAFAPLLALFALMTGFSCIAFPKLQRRSELKDAILGNL